MTKSKIPSFNKLRVVTVRLRPLSLSKVEGSEVEPLKVGKLFVLVILLVVSIPAFAQDTLWIRTYGGSNVEWLYAGTSTVQQTTDGGFIVVGETYSFGAGGSDVYLIKTNPLGDTLWSRTYGGTSDEIGVTVQQTRDGGYIITGATDDIWSPSSDVFLIKTDSIGNIIWNRAYGGNNWDMGHWVEQTSDGGYIVVGWTLSFGAGGTDIYVIKTDSVGDISCSNCWSRTYGGSGWDGVAPASRTSDGGYLLAGDTYSFGTGVLNDAYVIKIDSTGQIIWNRTYSAYGWEHAQARETPDGGYIVVGNTHYAGGPPHDIFLFKTDSTGDIACENCWTRTYGASGDDAIGTFLVMPDGRYSILGGTSSFGAGGVDICLLEIASTGDILRTQTYGGMFDDYGSSIQKTTDGGYIVAGWSHSFGAGESDVMLIKLDSSGHTCIGELGTFTAQSVSSTVTNPATVVTSPSTIVTSPAITATSPATQVTTVCVLVRGDLMFRPNPDGWQFGNSDIVPDPPYNGDPIMWPQYWWQQFNYCQYPYPWLWCFLCRSSDFPDWPLFVSAFGEDQCYYDPPPGLVIYKPRAVLRWFALKRGWGGSCFGFAISSFLFFDDYLNISSEFPGYTQVYSVPINDQSRFMQNKYWIYQFGKAQQQHINANYNSTTPNQTLQACQTMFNASTRDDRILVMLNNHGSGGHAVNAYRCEVDAENPEITHVYVYDNNFPGDESRRVSINTSTNTWTYDGQPGWGGAKHLFLMEPISNYTTNPVMPISIPPRERWISEKDHMTSEYVEFYLWSTDTALFQSSAGSIGHIGDSLFTTLSDGHPIIPLTGQETEPIGYYLPNDIWTCQFSGITDSIFRFSLFTDSSVMVYWRTGVDSTQSEKLRYPGNDSTLMIHNPDSESRSYNLEFISSAADSEIYYSVVDILIDHGDSARYSTKPAYELQLDNYGEAKTYDLRIEIAGMNVDTVFFHEEITLYSNSSHLIVPDWRPYGDSLMILVDSGMVGSFSDTVFVENQGEFIRGDANGDGVINSADVVYLINYLFKGGPPPEPLEAGDVNCDGIINSADVVYLINYLFKGGPPPCG
jgi:hypothetical protein